MIITEPGNVVLWIIENVWTETTSALSVTAHNRRMVNYWSCASWACPLRTLPPPRTDLCCSWQDVDNTTDWTYVSEGRTLTLTLLIEVLNWTSMTLHCCQSHVIKKFCYNIRQNILSVVVLLMQSTTSFFDRRDVNGYLSKMQTINSFFIRDDKVCQVSRVSKSWVHSTQ